jgi:tetratricopeptide (TPR) repeat protein/DNA-binding CsgD family transcriptional regulator
MYQKNRPKPGFRQKDVGVSVLEARFKRAIRPKDRLWAMIRLAGGLRGKNATQTKRALILFAGAECLAESIHDRRGLAAAIRGTGSCQFDLFDNAAALELFGRALPIAEQTGDVEMEIIILLDMGHVYVRQSRNDLALETLQKCAELAELIGNYRMQASALNQKGRALMDLGRYQEAIECHTKSLALFDYTGWADDQAVALIHLSNALRFLGRYAEALSSLERASELLNHARLNRQNEAICQGSIGIIYVEIGDYLNAISSLFACAKILERIGDKLNLANTYGNLMHVCLLLGNVEQATDFGEKALAIFEKIGNKRGQAGMFVNLAEQYLYRDQRTRTKQLLNQCLTLSREIGSKDYETAALIILAKLEVDLDRFTTAEKLYQKALFIANASGDRDSTTAALLGLGSLFNKQRKPERALSFLENAIVTAEEIHSRRYEQEAHQMLAEALEAKSDFKFALTHTKLASSIKEEILGLEKQKAITKLQIRSDIEKSEQEKVLLKKEMEIKSQEIEKMAMMLMEKTETIRSTSRHIREIVKQCSTKRGSQFNELLAEIGARVPGTGDREIKSSDPSPRRVGDAGFSDSGSRSPDPGLEEFHLVYRDTLRKFSKHYPTLTMTERKISVLLADGLSTKQMSLLLKITPHTIEWHRRHIRKKMKLRRGANLTAVLAGISGKDEGDSSDNL